MINRENRIEIVEFLKDAQAVILDLSDKVRGLDLNETDLDSWWEDKRLEICKMAEVTSAMADELSYMLSDCDDCLGDRIYEKNRDLKEIEEAEEDEYTDNPAYLSNSQRGLM